MAASFWQTTNSPTGWDKIKSLWQGITPSRLLPQKSFIIPSLPPGVTLKKAKMEASPEYAKFIFENFNNSLTSSTKLPSDFLNLSFIGVEARDIDRKLIGFILSKHIELLYNSEHPLQPIRNLGLVDYFCVVPIWRKKGIGTALLLKLHEITTAAGRIGHIFASEGSSIFSRIPNFYESKYFFRQRQRITDLKIQVEVNQNITITKEFVNQILKYTAKPALIGFDPNIKTNISHYEFHDYNMSADILVRPTYELYYGKKVGEIIAFWTQQKDSEQYLDTILDFVGEYDVFLVPSEFPRTRSSWMKGASFGYYAFQFHPGGFDTKTLLLLYP